MWGAGSPMMQPNTIIVAMVDIIKDIQKKRL